MLGCSYSLQVCRDKLVSCPPISGCLAGAQQLHVIKEIKEMAIHRLSMEHSLCMCTC